MSKLRTSLAMIWLPMPTASGERRAPARTDECTGPKLAEGVGDQRRAGDGLAGGAVHGATSE